MPVKLYTGLPGAGKTLGLVHEMLKLRQEEPGRPVFVYGVNGLKDGIASPLTDDDVRRWDELPPGSIVCIDECQELMPVERGNTPEWIRKLSKVRHHGIDFILTTQHPALMSAYVRRLVDMHVHLVRKFNTHVVDRYQWGRCMDDPEKRFAQKSAISSLWTHPKEVFELYKSASLHTMKRRIPAKVYYFIALLVIGVAAVISVPFLIRRAQQHNVETITAGTTPATKEQGGASSSSDPDQGLRRSDFEAWMRPRVPGLPWSAPAYDNLQVRSVPRLFCIAVDDGRCTCHTEQGTRYEMPADRCRSIAANGIYNPFVGDEQPQTAEQRQESAVQPRQLSPAGPAIAGGAVTADDAADAGRPRATAAAYVPPEFHAWNPDALGERGAFKR